MGWNTLEDTKTKLFQEVPQNSSVYFVHSYFAELSEYTIATTSYINKFSASLHKDNFFATQFHPEKSGVFGQQILSNFIEL